MAKKSLKTARLALETSPTPKASGDVPTQTVTPLNDLPILISSTGQNVNLDTSFVVGYAHDSTGSPYAVRMTLRQLMAYVGGSGGSGGSGGGSGEPGAPGDYTSFAFKKSDDQPATPQSSSPLPEGWSVLPDSDGKWWVSSSKVSGSTNTTYGGWGLPQPITAEDGAPGSMGPAGPFIETRYAANNSYTEAPALANPALRDPEGWVVGSQFDAGDLKAVWTINAKISSETDALMTNWSTPFCLTGGVPDYQINRFKKSDTAPSASTSQSQNPSGWLEAPDSTGKWWMTVGLVNGADGLVKGWSTPIQATGEDGVASDYYNFKYAVNQDPNNAPAVNSTSTDPGEAWGDIVPTTNKGWYLWMIIGKFHEGQLEGNWSTPVRLTGQDGTNGTDGTDGTDGHTITSRYQITSGPDDKPGVNRTEANPGSAWAVSVGDPELGEAVWMITAEFTGSGSLVGEWQGPFCMTGTKGEPGTSPTPPNYTFTVYAKSSSQPSAPTSLDPDDYSPLSTPWMTIPDSSDGTWWQCLGVVLGSTGKVDEWGSVLPLNGKDGTAQNGRESRLIFKKTNSWSEAPALDTSAVNPPGWTTDQSSLMPLGDDEYLWMSSGIIESTGTSMYQPWSTPCCITVPGPQGQQGPIGEPGNPGAMGPSGVPGVSIEIRYSLGSATASLAAAPVGNVRNPEGWSLTPPTPSSGEETNIYIWFVQARLTDYVPGESDGEVLDGWSTPARLSGVNGVDGIGTPGRAGQIVYPAGLYSPDVVYTCTDKIAPYVYDTSSSPAAYYVLNTIGNWQGSIQPAGSNTPSTSEDWVLIEAFDAIITKLGIIANALIGSAVFNGDYMFSMQGINAKGASTTNYEKFNAGNPDEVFRVYCYGGLSTPSKPTSTDPSSFPSGSGSSWQRYPTSTNGWYVCSGIIDGDTGQISEWGDVQVYSNSQVGYTTIWAYGDSYLSAPPLDKYSANPAGWTTGFSSLSGSGYLWFATGYSKVGVVDDDTSNVTPWQYPQCGNAPIVTGPAFTPNIMFNFATGEGHLAAGKIKFASDGSVILNNLLIKNSIMQDFTSYDISDGAEFSITALHSAIEGYPSSPSLGYINGTFNFYGLGLSAKETYSGSIRNDSTATVRLSYSYFGSGLGTNVQIINGIFLPCSSSSNVSSSNSSIAHFIDKVQLQPGASMKFNLAVGNLDYPVSGQMSARMYITNASDFEYSYTSNSAPGRPPRIGGANFRGADFSVASSLVGILRYEYDGNGDRLSTIIVNKLRSGLQYNVVSESKFSITFSLSGTDCPTGQSLAVLAQSSRSKSGSFMYPVYACVDYARTASPIQFTVSTIAGASGSSLDYGGAVLVFIYDMGDTSSL